MQELFKRYQIDCIRNKVKYKNYEELRRRIDQHLGIALVLKNRKIQQNKSSGTGLAATGKVSTQGVCSQWKQHGACNAGDNCPKDHPKDHPGVLFTPEVMFTMNRGNRFVDKESLSSNRDVSWAKKGFARN